MEQCIPSRVGSYIILGVLGLETAAKRAGCLLQLSDWFCSRPCNVLHQLHSGLIRRLNNACIKIGSSWL